MEQSLSIKECLSFGWKTFTQRPWYFVGVTLLFIIINILIPNADEQSPWTIALLVFVISMLLTFLLQLAGTSFALKAHEAPQSASLRDMWRPELYLRYVGSNILQILAVLVGLILLIIPGIIVGIALTFTNFLVVDRGLRPVESLKTSWALTKGYRWKLFGLMLVLVVLNILGLILLVVGLLVTLPVSMFALVHAYRLVEGYKREALPAPDAAPVLPTPAQA